MGEVFHAVETTGLNPVHRAGRHPGAFVVTGRDLAVPGVYADAVRCAEARGYRLELFAIGTDLHQRAGVARDGLETTSAALHRSSLGEVEVAFLVGLEVEEELVKPFGGGHRVVEVFVIVRLTVVVVIVVTGELVAAGGVDLVVDDAQSQRLVHARSEARPLQVFQALVDA